jgi:hypothetical protein
MPKKFYEIDPCIDKIKSQIALKSYVSLAYSLIRLLVEQISVS